MLEETITIQALINLNLFIVCHHVLVDLLQALRAISIHVDVHNTVILLEMFRLANISVSVIQMPIILQGHVKRVTLVVS